MTPIEKFRKKNPAYSNRSDMDLAQALHRKHYSDMDFNEFASSFGVAQAAPIQAVPRETMPIDRSDVPTDVPIPIQQEASQPLSPLDMNAQDILARISPSPFGVTQLADANTMGDRRGLGETLEPFIAPAQALTTMAAATPVEALAGGAGIAQTLNPWADPGAGDRAVEGTRNLLTYTPGLAQGQGILQQTGEAMEPLTNLLMKAKTITGGAGNYLMGPVGGALGEAVPEALLSIPAFFGARSMLGQQSAKKRRIANEFLEGLPSRDTAGYQLMNAVDRPDKRLPPPSGQAMQRVDAPESQAISPEQLYDLPPETPSPSGMVQRMIEESKPLPRVGKRPIAKTALDVGWDEGLVATVQQASPVTRKKMDTMMRILEKGKKLTKYAASKRPSIVVGDALKQRYKYVSEINRKAGEQIDSIVTGIDGWVDVSQPYRNLRDSLETIGVKFKTTKGGRTRPDFKDSDWSAKVPDARAAQNIMSAVLEKMQKTDMTNPVEAHKFKRFLDTQVKFGKSENNAAGAAEKMLKNLRRDINKSIGDISDDYRSVNETYSETVGAMNALQDVAGKKVKIGKTKRDDDMLGTLMRRLTGNPTSRVPLTNAIEQLESVAVKHGAKFGDDLMDLQVYANSLEDTFGSFAPTSFRGEIGSEWARNAVDAGFGMARGSPTDTVAAASGAARRGLFKKQRRATEAAAIKSMRDLLKERGLPEY